MTDTIYLDYQPLLLEYVEYLLVDINHVIIIVRFRTIINIYPYQYMFLLDYQPSKHVYLGYQTRYLNYQYGLLLLDIAWYSMVQ